MLISFVCPIDTRHQTPSPSFTHSLPHNRSSAKAFPFSVVVSFDRIRITSASVTIPVTEPPHAIVCCHSLWHSSFDRRTAKVFSMHVLYERISVRRPVF